MILKHRNLAAIVILIAQIAACNNSPLQNITKTVNVEPVSRPQITLSDSIPDLIKILRGPDTEAKIMAAVRLGNMSKMAEPAIPALPRNLYDENSEVRRRSAEALGKIGSESKVALPYLTVVLLKDSFVHARAASAKALGQIGDASSVPALASALNDSEHEVQINAAVSIGLLTGQKFTDMDTKGYSLDKNGTPIIVLDAIEWWNKQGRLQDWVKIEK